MYYFIFVCQIDAISMLLYKFFQLDCVTKFFQKHRIISLIYLILGAIGLFSAIFHYYS